MSSSAKDFLMREIGGENVPAFERFLQAEHSLYEFIHLARDGDLEWQELARGAAVLQCWLETRGRQATFTRKFGYLICTIEGQKNMPILLRPTLAQAVSQMLEQYGFEEV